MTKRSWGKGLLLVGFGAPTFHFFISSTSYFLVVKKNAMELGSQKLPFKSHLVTAEMTLGKP